MANKFTLEIHLFKKKIFPRDHLGHSYFVYELVVSTVKLIIKMYLNIKI